jgi:hypothetical protein
MLKVIAITQIVVGGTITATGIFNPFLLIGPAIAVVGGGCLTLLDEHSPAGRWIGFQIIMGIGVGVCLTIPLMLAQIIVKTKDVPTATAITICKLSLGSSVLCSLIKYHSRSIYGQRHVHTRCTSRVPK